LGSDFLHSGQKTFGLLKAFQAQILQPGERVVIMTGVYRERVAPRRGGTGPDKMISYEAAPGANVIVKGSRIVKTAWEPSIEYLLGPRGSPRPTLKIYQRRLDDLDFQGYNPFGVREPYG